MSTRTTKKYVTFNRPFFLSEPIGDQPAGVYEVSTDEESIDNITRLAYRRVATLLEVRRSGLTQLFGVDPVELDAALLRDAGRTVVV